MDDYERHPSSESVSDPFDSGVGTDDLLARIHKGRLDEVGSLVEGETDIEKNPINASYVVDGVEKDAEITIHNNIKPVDPGAEGEPPVYDIFEARKTRSKEEQEMIEKSLLEIGLFSQRIAEFENRIKINEQPLDHMKSAILSAEFSELSGEVVAFMHSLSLEEIKDTKIRPAFNTLVDQLFILRDHVAEEIEY